MITNKNNNTLEQHDLTNNSLSEESINQIPSIILPYQSNFILFNIDDHRIEDGAQLNNNHNISSLLQPINNIDNEDFERYEKPTNLATNEEKNSKGKKFSQVNPDQKQMFCCTIDESTTIKNIGQKNNLNTDKKLGRKKKSDRSKSEHSKYSDDNLRRKCKHIVLSSIMEFINEKIDTLYNGNIGNNIFLKKLLTLNKNQKADATINYNQNFLNKKLGDIFSEEISGKFTNYFPDHNKLLIKTLTNEEDVKKKTYFINLFNLTFLQCLNHYRGTEKIDELNGVKCFDDYINNLNDEADEYKKILDFYINNFEKIIMRKKSRKSKLKNGEDEINNIK